MPNSHLKDKLAFQVGLLKNAPDDELESIIERIITLFGDDKEKNLLLRNKIVIQLFQFKRQSLALKFFDSDNYSIDKLNEFLAQACTYNLPQVIEHITRSLAAKNDHSYVETISKFIKYDRYRTVQAYETILPETLEVLLNYITDKEEFARRITIKDEATFRIFQKHNLPVYLRNLSHATPHKLVVAIYNYEHSKIIDDSDDIFERMTREKFNELLLETENIFAIMLLERNDSEQYQVLLDKVSNYIDCFPHFLASPKIIEHLQLDTQQLIRLANSILIKLLRELPHDKKSVREKLCHALKYLETRIDFKTLKTIVNPDDQKALLEIASEFKIHSLRDIVSTDDNKKTPNQHHSQDVTNIIEALQHGVTLPPRTIQNLIDQAARGVTSNVMLPVLIKVYGERLLNHPPYRERLLSTPSPQVAMILMQAFPDESLFDEPKLKKLYQTACLSYDLPCIIYFTALLQPHQLESMPFVSPIKPNEASQNRIAGYNTGLSQTEFKAYQRYMAALVCQALQDGTWATQVCFNEKPSNHIDHEFLGQLRQDMAFMQGTSDYSSFGCYRISKSGFENNIVTGIYLPQYRLYLNRFITQLDNYGLTINENGESEFGDSSSLDGCVFGKPEDVETSFNLCIRGDINGGSINLTRILNNIEQGRRQWGHTYPQEIDKILKHVDKLILELKNQKPNRKDEVELLNKLGEIHWWLAHAAAFCRGSAAITEAIIMGLALFNGYSITWDHQDIKDFMPDCEALITPKPEIYAEQYQSFAKLTPLVKNTFIKKSTDDNYAKLRDSLKIATNSHLTSSQLCPRLG